MPFRIAIIADIHLPDYPESAQHAAFDWALRHLRQEPVDVLMVAGDVTAAGTALSARMARAKLDASGLIYRMTGGNSDRRTLDDWHEACGLLTVAAPFTAESVCVISFETSDETVGQADRGSLVAAMEQAGDRRVVVVTHMPPEALQPDDRAWLASVLGGGRIDLFIAGHHHVDDAYTVGGAPVHLVRGLDPDKAIGGPPALTYFELDGKGWRRRDVAFDGGQVEGWSERERGEFLDNLGFSCMDQTLEGMEQARRRGVRCVELRAGDAMGVGPEALARTLGRWRKAGGRYLSVHMPDVHWDAVRRRGADTQPWRDAVAFSLAHGAAAMTVHVPRASVADMAPGGRAWREMAALTCETLRPAMNAGTVVSIENLHLSRGQPADASRQFGCLPKECLDWVATLRRVSGYDRIGLHLDIGHARNNPPFSKRLCVGHWYVLTGAQISGYHLHQVRSIEGVGMRNHFAFEGLYGPLISLSSFFWAWRAGRLRHAPMFLEVRSPGTGWDALDTLRGQIAGSVWLSGTPR